jgi:uncharacterized membrane protein
MGRRAAITINRPREEVQLAWTSSMQELAEATASVRFAQAPGDHGTELHVELLEDPPAGKLGEMALKLTGSEPLAKAKDELRRFKQKLETGEIPRSDAVPEGELAERKLHQRPAQPLDDRELKEVGA